MKIGYAHNIESRLRKLNRSETVPFAFCVNVVYTVESVLMDKELHKLIDRLNPDLRAIETFDGRERVKEFYAMSPEAAYGLLESIAKISGTLDRLCRMTPEGHEILDEQIVDEVRETARRGSFHFGDYGIPVGSQLEFVGDPSVKVTVLDDRHISYHGEKTSHSALAQKLKGYDLVSPSFLKHTSSSDAYYLCKSESTDSIPL